jgi:hypothetical protein
MNKQELKDKIKLMVKQVSPFTKETSDVLPSSDDISLDDNKFPILSKFPSLKEIIEILLTEQYEVFIKEIHWVAPRPTTFRVLLINDEDFYLIYSERTWIAQIEGKKYYLLDINDEERAVESISRVLAYRKYDPKAAKDIDNKSMKDTENGGSSSGGGNFGGGNFGGGDSLPPGDETPRDGTPGDGTPGDGTPEEPELKPEDFLQENNINEIEITDDVKIKIKQIAVLYERIETLSKELKNLQDNYKELAEVITPIIEELDDTKKEFVEVDDVIISLKRRGFSRTSRAYKEAFDWLESRVNGVMRALVNEAIQKTEKTAHIASALDIKRKKINEISEDQISKLKSYFTNMRNVFSKLNDEFEASITGLKKIINQNLN